MTLLILSAKLTCHKNTFSKYFSSLGLNIFEALVVDLLHEVELGVWRSLLIHLLRIINSIDKDLVHELDRRSGSLFLRNERNAHTLCLLIDTDWFHHLGNLLSGDSLQIPQSSPIWRHIILKIFSRYCATYRLD
jgi:hypothetical protein